MGKDGIHLTDQGRFNLFNTLAKAVLGLRSGSLGCPPKSAVAAALPLVSGKKYFWRGFSSDRGSTVRPASRGGARGRGSSTRGASGGGRGRGNRPTPYALELTTPSHTAPAADAETTEKVHRIFHHFFTNFNFTSFSPDKTRKNFSILMRISCNITLKIKRQKVKGIKFCLYLLLIWIIAALHILKCSPLVYLIPYFGYAKSTLRWRKH